MAVTSFNLQNLRGQSPLFRCLDTGFVTTPPAVVSWWASGRRHGAGVAP
jgi:hypothetical protein